MIMNQPKRDKIIQQMCNNAPVEFCTVQREENNNIKWAMFTLISLEVLVCNNGRSNH